MNQELTKEELKRFNPKNLNVEDSDGIEQLFRNAGFTEERGIEFSEFVDMSGWGYLPNQEGFGVKFRNEADQQAIEDFAETLPFLTYITEMCASDDEGKFYDLVYYVDNAAHTAFKRREVIEKLKDAHAKIYEARDIIGSLLSPDIDEVDYDLDYELDEDITEIDDVLKDIHFMFEKYTEE